MVAPGRVYFGVLVCVECPHLCARPLFDLVCAKNNQAGYDRESPVPIDWGAVRCIEEDVRFIASGICCLLRVSAHLRERRVVHFGNIF